MVAFENPNAEWQLHNKKASGAKDHEIGCPVWRHPDMQSLLIHVQDGSYITRFDQCYWGDRSREPTCVLFACKWLTSWEIKELTKNMDGRLCTCSFHEVVLKGKARGAWATNAAKCYNMAFAAELAYTIDKIWMARNAKVDAMRVAQSS